MTIYIISFIISFLFISISNRFESNNNKLYRVFEFLGIGILSLLAALRDDTVGTDMLVYIKPIFTTFVNYGFVLEYVKNIDIELLYLIFNYMISLITNDFRIFLFIMQFLILFITYEGIKKIKPQNHNLMYIVFIMLMFNKSLNIARQCLAIALVTYSISYIKSKDLKKFLTTIIIAFFLHRTAIFMVVLYPIYYIRNSKNKKTYMFIIITLALVLTVLFQPALKFIIDIGLLPQRYNTYLTIYMKNGYDLDFIELALDLIILILTTLYRKTIGEHYHDEEFYRLLLLFDILMILVGGNIKFVSRLGIYFKIPALTFLMSSLKLIVKNKDKIIMDIFIILILCFYWYYIFVYSNVGNTIPYSYRQ